MPTYRAVIEIVYAKDGLIPECLLKAAYRASRDQPIVLVFDPSVMADVDRCLDLEVLKAPRFKGVRYIGAKDTQAIACAISEAAVAIGTSSHFLNIVREARREAVRETPRLYCEIAALKSVEDAFILIGTDEPSRDNQSNERVSLRRPRTFNGLISRSA